MEEQEEPKEMLDSFNMTRDIVVEGEEEPPED